VPKRQQVKDGSIPVIDQHFHAKESRGVIHKARPVEKRLPDRCLHSVFHFEC
jgi:hypothetical protein